MRPFLYIIFIILLFSPAYLWAIEPTEDELIEQLEVAYLPDNKINLAESALILSKAIYPKIDVNNYLERLGEIANEIKSRLKSRGSAEPSQIISEINKFFREKKIKAESILTTTPSLLFESERDKFLFNKVVDSMSGNCLGLTTLYWSIAEQLDLPLSAVIIPQHVFLRFYADKEKYRNIEPTAGGAEVEDAEYIKQTKKLIGDKIPVNSTPDKVNFYVLSKKQFIGLILYNRGVDYLRQNNFQVARRDFDSALRLYEGFHEAYKSRAAIYLKEDKFQDAIADLKRAMSLEPDCPTTYFSMGNAYFNLKEFNEAMKYFDRAIDLVPQYLEAYHHRGLCYTQQQRYSSAISDLSFVINASPSAKAYYDRGIIHFNMKKYKEAIKDYTEAITRDEKLVDAYNNRGIVYATCERYPEAVKDFEQAISLNPENVSCYKNLGFTFYKMKDYRKALEVLEKYLKLNPTDEEVIKLIEQLK